MTDNSDQQKRIHEITLRLEGDAMLNGAVEYKTLFEVIDGTAGSIESLVRISAYDRPVAFNVTPAREKCFEITLQMVEWLGVAAPLLQEAPTIKDLTTIFLEYLKIKKALKGEDLKEGMVQNNDAGGVTITNGSGAVIYNDNRTIINKNTIVNVAKDPALNKKVDKIAKALEKSGIVDSLEYDQEEETLIISKNDSKFFEYEEKFEEKPDSITGYIREINNKTSKGLIVTDDEGSERCVYFEIDIDDISLLEKVVTNLAIAEADRSLVVMTGEKILYGNGKPKKILVKDIDIPNKKLGF
jgi:hypothetical protein